MKIEAARFDDSVDVPIYRSGHMICDATFRIHESFDNLLRYFNSFLLSALKDTIFSSVCVCDMDFPLHVLCVIGRFHHRQLRFIKKRRQV